MDERKKYEEVMKKKRTMKIKLWEGKNDNKV
jgi:hypothetical protein